MKLPKQWKHWCSSARLRPFSGRFLRNGGGHGWFYLRGRGHYWRVNCHGMFQRGDTYEAFDRWALCDIQEAPMPKTRDEFVAAVKSLLKEKP